MTEKCSISHCEKEVMRKGLCVSHYRQALKENPWQNIR